MSLTMKPFWLLCSKESCEQVPREENEVPREENAGELEAWKRFFFFLTLPHDPDFINVDI